MRQHVHRKCRRVTAAIRTTGNRVIVTLCRLPGCWEPTEEGQECCSREHFNTHYRRLAAELWCGQPRGQTLTGNTR